jgi:hypothetical protein
MAIKIYNQKDFELDVKLSKEYIYSDMGLYVYIFSLNIIDSVKDIYGESLPSEKEFLDPIKLSAFVNTNETTTTKIKNVLVDQTIENVEFGLFIDDLKKYNLDPKRGDYLLYDDNNNKRFFQIDSITHITTNNNMNNYKEFYRYVKATYVKDYELPENLKNKIR